MAGGKSLGDRRDGRDADGDDAHDVDWERAIPFEMAV